MLVVLVVVLVSVILAICLAGFALTVLRLSKMLEYLETVEDDTRAIKAGGAVRPEFSASSSAEQELTREVRAHKDR